MIYNIFCIVSGSNFRPDEVKDNVTGIHVVKPNRELSMIAERVTAEPYLVLKTRHGLVTDVYRSCCVTEYIHWLRYNQDLLQTYGVTKIVLVYGLYYGMLRNGEPTQCNGEILDANIVRLFSQIPHNVDVYSYIIDYLESQMDKLEEKTDKQWARYIKIAPTCK